MSVCPAHQTAITHSLVHRRETARPGPALGWESGGQTLNLLCSVLCSSVKNSILACDIFVRAGRVIEAEH